MFAYSTLYIVGAAVLIMFVGTGLACFYGSRIRVRQRKMQQRIDLERPPVPEKPIRGSPDALLWVSTWPLPRAPPPVVGR